MTYILVLIIIILLIIIIYENIKINNISRNVQEVIKGNFNERIRIGDHSKIIKKLIINLNRLIDEFQKTISLNKKYEDDRKKMISNISHDFRTPLTSMLGYVEMLKNDKNLSKEESEEYLNIINIKGEVLRGLIEEFFSLSKFDANDSKIKPIRLNITEIIRQCALSFLKDFEIKGMELALDLPQNDIFIEADEAAIFRILHNLIGNSLKYGKDGNLIGIALTDKNEKIVIEIWDKGKGIPEEDITHIFQRLYSVDKSRNRELNGSGLGLTIVKKLIEKHGGVIEVTSIPYEKTVFKVTLLKKLRNV